MSTKPRRSAAASELRDWKLWLITAGAAVAVVHALPQRLDSWAALVLLPLPALVALVGWAWLRRRPTGFAAEATRALAGHLPDGGRAPRVVRSDSHGSTHWAVSWPVNGHDVFPGGRTRCADLDSLLALTIPPDTPPPTRQGGARTSELKACVR